MLLPEHRRGLPTDEGFARDLPVGLRLRALERLEGRLWPHSV